MDGENILRINIELAEANPILVINCLVQERIAIGEFVLIKEITVLQGCG